jgi:hypothetical protein
MTLINEDYKRQLQEMHANSKKFTRSGEKKLGMIKSFIETFSCKYSESGTEEPTKGVLKLT